jgi:hypothetical protein
LCSNWAETFAGSIMASSRRAAAGMISILYFFRIFKFCKSVNGWQIYHELRI